MRFKAFVSTRMLTAGKRVHTTRGGVRQFYTCPKSVLAAIVGGGNRGITCPKCLFRRRYQRTTFRPTASMPRRRRMHAPFSFAQRDNDHLSIAWRTLNNPVMNQLDLVQ